MTYTHTTKNGVTFAFSPDLSGHVTIGSGDQVVEVAADDLKDFMAYVDRVAHSAAIKEADWKSFANN